MPEEELDVGVGEDDDDFDLESLGGTEESSSSNDVSDEARTRATLETDLAGLEDDDDDDFMDALGLQQEGNDINLSKPWMKYHKFELVKTAVRVRELVDEALKEGNVGLDLETEGFDNRIEYDDQGKPYTRHRIVGYCFGLKGQGYYIPVRHKSDGIYRSDSPNVDNLHETEKEISRLCNAAQPVLTEAGKATDPLSSKSFETPPRVVIEFWHSKFDQEFLYPITGIDWWHPDSFEDGMLANYVNYTDDDHGLKENAARKIKPIEDENGEKHHYEMIKFSDLFPKGMKKDRMKFADIFPETDGNGWNGVLYGCSDGICTNLLCKVLVPPVLKDPKLSNTYRLEKQVVQAVRILERARVQIDRDEIRTLLDEAESEFYSYEKKIKDFARLKGFENFNPGGTGQLAEFLFEERGLNLNPKPEKTSEGQYKTDEKTIEALAESNPESEVLLWIIKYRQISKVKGTYLQNLANNTDELNQLRLNFKQTGAATGRFTAPKGDADHGFGGVPIQGIPARDDPKKPKVAHSLRRLFVARKGYVMVKVDYASQELRIASNVSGEPKWIREYEKEAQTGEPADLHFLTAQAFYPGLKRSDAGTPDYKMKRNAGKTANFALVYGGGVGAVQRATGCDKHEGARLKKAFDDSVPIFSKWVKAQHVKVKKQKGVMTAFGRFIRIPDASITPEQVRERAANQKVPRELSKNEAWKESKKIQAACERKSTNFPIQGSGADILKISLVMLVKELHMRGWLRNGGDDSVRMVMTVHDEIVFEIKEDRLAEALPIILKVMEYPSTLAKWKVPLIAEAEIGTSWSAKLDWLSMLRGDPKHPVPDFLKGKEVVKDPDLLILAKKPQPSSASPKPEPVKLSTETPPPEAVVEQRPADPINEALEELSSEEMTIEAAEPQPVPRVVNGKYKEYALFYLNTSLPTMDTVCSVYQAIEFSYAEAIKQGKEDLLIPVEIRDREEDVYYPANKLYLVLPEALSLKFSECHLGQREYKILPFEN